MEGEMKYKWRETSSWRAMCHQGRMQIKCGEISPFWETRPFSLGHPHISCFYQSTIASSRADQWLHCSTYASFTHSTIQTLIHSRIQPFYSTFWMGLTSGACTHSYNYPVNFLLCLVHPYLDLTCTVPYLNVVFSFPYTCSLLERGCCHYLFHNFFSIPAFTRVCTWMTREMDWRSRLSGLCSIE